MSRRPEPPTFVLAQKFCRVHLGSDCFTPFTGQDWSAWIAFVYLIELYGRGDANARAAAVEAMRHVLEFGPQRRSHIHQLFVQAIPAVLDWSHAQEIWPQLHAPFALAPVREAK